VACKPIGKKIALGAVRGERGEHRRSVLRPRPVVESEHDLPFAQEVVALEVLESETGAAAVSSTGHRHGMIACATHPSVAQVLLH
jgi:hypothetical protein